MHLHSFKNIVTFAIVLTPISGFGASMECSLPAISGQIQEYSVHNWASPFTTSADFVMSARNNDTGEPVPAYLWAPKQEQENGIYPIQVTFGNLSLE